MIVFNINRFFGKKHLSKACSAKTIYFLSQPYTALYLFCATIHLDKCDTTLLKTGEPN